MATLPAIAIARPPRAVRSLQALPSFFASRPKITTAISARVIRSAIASPIPLPPPVIIPTCFERSLTTPRYRSRAGPRNASSRPWVFPTSTGALLNHEPLTWTEFLAFTVRRREDDDPLQHKADFIDRIRVERQRA